MSELSQLAEQIQEAQAAVAYLEKLIALRPDTHTVLSNLNVQRQRLEELETAFGHLASESSIDVLNYRLFSETGSSPSLPGITSALASFQELYSLVYDAITDKPKHVSHISAGAVAATTFGFGYTYSSSVGFVLTLSNERLLFFGSKLDEAMNIVFSMAKLTGPAQITEYARMLGPAAIRNLHRWAESHVSACLGADIDWRRDDEIRAKLFVQVTELTNLIQVIAETTDVMSETFTAVGTLVGYDVFNQSFQMRFLDGGEVRGDVLEGVGRVVVPHDYSAVIQKTTQVQYATDTEDVKYCLVSLAS